MNFTIIIPTNKVTDEIDHNIKILSDSLKGSEIVVINYNQFHIQYRKTEGILYKQISLNRSDAIDMYMLKYCNNDNIIIINPYIKITNKFLNTIRNDYNPTKIGTCRIDIIKNGTVIIDKRIGSSISPGMITNDVLIFNKTVTGVFNKRNISQFCKDSHQGLILYKNTKVYRNKHDDINNITIIIPSKSTSLKPFIDSIKMKGDIVNYFNIGKRTISHYLNKYILTSPNDTIVFINPESSIFDKSIIDDIRTFNTTTNVYDNLKTYDIKNLTNDCIISFVKSLYKDNYIITDNIIDIQRYILGASQVRYKTPNNDISSFDAKVTHNKKDNKYSIIIPFMFNGDRWDIFKASIECLYKHTQQYENIEIVVHETAPNRFLTQEFIDKFQIVYGYSKWDDHFHRGWSLNVAARHLSKGDIFVFFDADLLITKEWVRELLNCNRGDIKIGWGTMKNLTKNATNHYIKTNQIYNDNERIRKPSSHGAGGGINIISKDIFYKIKGWPEEFTSYGGEDNVYNFKLHSFGYTRKDY